MKNLKVSSLFHWLYGAVMFLPILLLPVFMIYSHRHTIDSGTLEVPQNEVVDFNQLLRYGDFSSNNDGYWRVTSGTLDINENKGIITNINDASTRVEIYTNGITTYNNHKYYCSTSFESNYNLSFLVSGIGDSATISSQQNVSTGRYDFIATQNVNNNNTYFDVYYYLDSENHLPSTYSISNFNFMLIDLTQMFGAGNEPFLAQFKQWYDDDYYSYTLSRKELLKNTSTITYSDTDIMSQATYQLYNATNKYFNVSQFFGLENLWDYMVLNWFGGNVTIYLRIFWQLLTYWLVVSIAWLIFDLFMYVPKLAHRWLDRSAIE